MPLWGPRPFACGAVEGTTTTMGAWWLGTSFSGAVVGAETICLRGRRGNDHHDGGLVARNVFQRCRCGGRGGGRGRLAIASASARLLAQVSWISPWANVRPNHGTSPPIRAPISAAWGFRIATSSWVTMSVVGAAVGGCAAGPAALLAHGKDLEQGMCHLGCWVQVLDNTGQVMPCSCILELMVVVLPIRVVRYPVQLGVSADQCSIRSQGYC